MNDYVVTEDIRFRLGKYAKKIREEKKLGLNQFCLKVDIHPSLYSKFENGKVQKINPFLLKKIAYGLEIDYKELYRIIGYLEEQDFEENTLLKAKLLECEKKLEITHNGTGQIVVGNNNQIGGSSIDGKLQKEFEDLSQRQREKVLKFIEDFIK